MSEVKKLIISRKKIDQHGNEYALIKISSNQQKRPEIRVVKFKKSPKKSKPKKQDNNDNSISTNKYSSKSGKILNEPKNPLNSQIMSKNVKSKICDSSTTKSSKFNSFISTFNTPSKEKNSFIYNSPKPYIKPKNYNFRYLNSPYLNNYIYSPNFSKNNSEIFKTEYNINNICQEKKLSKNKENLNNKIIILSQKNRQCLDKINSLKNKQNKLNNIKAEKLKDKHEIKIAKNKTKYETEFKKQILEQIKEINKYKKEAVKEINKKENIIKKSNMKKENTKVKNMIKDIKKINYQKNRANYLKIRKEEERLRNKRLRFNIPGNKKCDNYFSFTKLLIDDDQKEIDELKKKYEKLKVINSEYNSYIKEIENMDFKRTFTPSDFRKFSKNQLSYSILETIPKIIISTTNSPRKSISKAINKNNSIHLV